MAMRCMCDVPGLVSRQASPHGYSGDVVMGGLSGPWTERRTEESLIDTGFRNKHVPFIWIKNEASVSCWAAKLQNGNIWKAGTK